MTKHIGAMATASPLHPEYTGPNASTASPTGMQKIAQAQNFIACTQKKVPFWRAQKYTGLLVPSGASNEIWPHCFRTGENTTAVRLLYGVTNPTGASGGPIIRYDVYTFSAGTTADAAIDQPETYYTGTRSVGDLAPNEVAHGNLIANGLSPNTLYHARLFADNYAVLTYAVVHEGRTGYPDDSVTGVCNPDKYHVEGPIYDEHALDLSDSCNKLWRHNGAHLLSWSCDYHTTHASVPSTASTSYVDILSNNAAVQLQTQYHGTRRRPSTIPVVMYVSADRTAGAGTADFRLTDGTNNIDISAAAITSTRTWFTVTGTISDTPATWEMRARVSVGTTTVRISGWSLFEYEA